MRKKVIDGCVRLFGFAAFMGSTFFGADAPNSPKEATGQTWPVLWISRVTPDRFHYASFLIWFAWITTCVGGAVLFLWGDENSFVHSEAASVISQPQPYAASGEGPKVAQIGHSQARKTFHQSGPNLRPPNPSE